MENFQIPQKINEFYNIWLEKATADPDLNVELTKISAEPAEINDRFYRELEFGTAGLRGVIGAGTNRMNYYTVARATQGLANYVLADIPAGDASVAIAYDSRIKSDYFSRIAAEVLAGNGIKVYIYSELMPTPMLSFAVRELKCDAGINVTASHNPSKFNGYKVYGSDGCQLTDDAANSVLEQILKTDIFSGFKTLDYETALAKGLIEIISTEVENAYYSEVLKASINPKIASTSGLKVVYTPLNGAGNKPVRKILSQIGISDVTIVPEQELPDGNFPTCSYPNPEFKEALELGLKLVNDTKADILIATDPDSDRVGMAAPDGNGGYEIFSGNEIGSLLLEYVISQRKEKNTLPASPVAVKSIVSTTLADKICEKYGVKLISVLTGFKYIGEQIAVLEKDGRESDFVFGFEESYGYLGGAYCRDKDAVIGSMLIAEMAAFYRSKGISLIEARNNIYKEYGFYFNKVDNLSFEGAAGAAKMIQLVNNLRGNYPSEICGERVVKFADYREKFILDIDTGSKTPINLPASNVIVLTLETDESIIVRPSGTEPKIKIYYTTIGKENMLEAQSRQDNFSSEFKKTFLG